MAIYHHLRGTALSFVLFIAIAFYTIVLVVLLPCRVLSPALDYHVSGSLASACWEYLKFTFELMNGAVITTSGDELPENEAALVIANHRCMFDFYMVQALALKNGCLGCCRYFVHAPWFLRWAIYVFGMRPRVTWAKEYKNNLMLDQTFSGILLDGKPTWVVSFCESTRYTHEKHDAVAAYCNAYGQNPPMHLLFPGPNEWITTALYLRNTRRVKAVYNLTLVYTHNGKYMESPTLWEALSLPSLSVRKGFRFNIHVERIPIELLPDDPVALGKWIEDAWQAKGQYIEALREVFQGTVTLT